MNTVNFIFDHVLSMIYAQSYALAPVLDGVSVSEQKPCSLDQMRGRLRVKHYSLRTKQASVDWINRFILFHAKRHPTDMGAPEIEVVLTHPVVDQKVSAAI